MTSKTLRLLSTTAILSVLFVGFQNCSGTNFTYDSATFASKATDSPETLNTPDMPVADVPATPTEPPPQAIVLPPPQMPAPAPVAPPDDENDEFADFYRGVCKELKDVTLPLMISPSAPDLTSKNSIHSVVIQEGRNVLIKNHAGQTRVYKAESLRLLNLAGKTLVSANNLTSAENIAGRLCINAVKVGLIHNVAINTKIIANEIDEISNIAGDIHVYRATVGLLKNSVGRVCLHDGAKILNVSNSYQRAGGCK